jgi:hypothetical protein
MKNGEWWFERRELITELIDGSNDEVLTQFLKDEKDRNCVKCDFWKNVGHYDSGDMGTCQNPKMYGRHHHPSSGCGITEYTMAYVPGTSDKIQEVQTRWNFGCTLWLRKNNDN